MSVTANILWSAEAIQCNANKAWSRCKLNQMWWGIEPYGMPNDSKKQPLWPAVTYLWEMTIAIPSNNKANNEVHILS